MKLVMFFTANLLVLVSAWYWVRCLRLRQPRDVLIAIPTIYLSQIVFTSLVAGIVLRNYTGITLLYLNGALLLIAGILARRAPKLASFTFLSKEELIACPMAWIIAGIFLVLDTISLAWASLLAFLAPTFSYDSMMYHMVSIAKWVQEKEFGLMDYSIWSNVYPHNAEMVFGWLFLFLGHDILVDAGQILFAIGGAAAVAGIGRELGLHKPYAILSASLFLLTPNVQAQLNTNYVDVAFASTFLLFVYFTLRFIHEKTMSYLLLSSITSGVLLGIKSSAVAYIGVMSVVVLTHLLRDGWARTGKVIGIFSFFNLLLGSFWYIRTWIVYGNPIYPFIVRIGDKVIFPGKGTVYDLIMANNTPPAIRGLPSWEQIWASWTSDALPFFLEGTYPGNIYDQGMGGLGPQWLYLQFPALLFFLVFCLIKHRFAFWNFAVPMLVIFNLQPSNYWARYTLFIVGLGAIAFAFLIQSVKPALVRAGLHTAAVFLVVLSLVYSLPHVYFTPAQVKLLWEKPWYERTIGMFWKQFAWVDQAPPGSRIAYSSENPFPYGLFGARYQHKVFRIQQPDSDQFIQTIKNGRYDYFFTKEGTEYYQWAQAHPELFTPFFHEYQHVAYIIKKSAQ
jgi:hypothetical protein